MLLEPCEISPGGRPRIAPRFSDGSTKPRPIRPTMAHSAISHSAVPRPTPIISTKDSASSTRPNDTSRCTGTRLVSRPATPMVPASTSPAGSSTAPACEGGSPSAICMNTGTR